MTLLKIAPWFCVVLLGCGSGSGGGGGGGGSDDMSMQPAGSEPTIGSTYTGDGTYYTATGAGACSYDATPNNLMVAAMNAPQWDTASVCGMCVEVSGPKGAANKVVIRIVDKCPECKTGDLDLSPQAFDMIAEHSAGRVQISWQQVACSVSGGLQYHFKDGSSQYWMAVQVRNSRFPVKKIELQQGQSWTPLTPVDYGYYIKDSNPGPGPFTFRVTSTTGDQITESGVILGDNTTFQGSQHF